MIKIGVCGLSGSGKSEFCSLFKENNAYVLELDKVGHELYKNQNNNVYKKIIQTFGYIDNLTDKDGNINRKILGKHVFSNEFQLAKLNEIFYNEFYQIVTNVIANKSFNMFVLDAAILFNAKLNLLMDYNILVDAPDEVLIKRLVLNRNIDEQYAKKIISFQKKQYIDDKVYEKVDFLVKNDDSKEHLKNEYFKVVERILQYDKIKAF